MSEQEKMNLFDRIRESISVAQTKMVERKAKLGETIVIADENGNPVVIPAADALSIYKD